MQVDFLQYPYRFHDMYADLVILIKGDSECLKLREKIRVEISFYVRKSGFLIKENKLFSVNIREI